MGREGRRDRRERRKGKRDRRDRRKGRRDRRERWEGRRDRRERRERGRVCALKYLENMKRCVFGLKEKSFDH